VGAPHAGIDDMSAMNEYAAIDRVAVRHARQVFSGSQRSENEWRALNFTAPPEPELAAEQADALGALLRAAGATVMELPPVDQLTMDAIYTRDASVVTPGGVVLCSMGKPARRAEPSAQGDAFRAAGIPVIGAIEPPGTLEGGDVVWFDQRTVAVGRGYRTNDEGIRQFREYLGTRVDVIVVPLPHYRGPEDVFHLMSILSPVDEHLAVVYSPLMPVPFRECLLGRGMRLVEVPDEEFESMGTNVLALAPRRVLMIEGNAVTRARLEAARAEVLTYDGSEISLKGGGGPTCLTRPLTRGARS
jgi:N-dimethylarginine dimethylaminohydrolase